MVDNPIYNLKMFFVRKEFKMFEGFEVLDSAVLASSGVYSKKRYWVKGWHTFKAHGVYVQFIHGYSGRETEVTVETIVPKHIVCLSH